MSRTTYGARADLAGLLRQALEQLFQFRGGTSSERERYLATTISILNDFKNSAEMSSQGDQSIFTLERRLRKVIADGERELGRVQDPDITVLNASIVNDERATSLLVRVSNDSDIRLNDVQLHLATVGGHVTVLDQQQLITELGPRSVKVVHFRVSARSTGKEEGFQIECSYKHDRSLYTAKRPVKCTVPLERYMPIEDRYIVGPAVTPAHPENFHGRDTQLDELVAAVKGQAEGIKGTIFIDGIRRVGKSSLINFALPRLVPDGFFPVRINAPLTPKDNVGTFFYYLTLAIANACRAAVPVSKDEFLRTPTAAFEDSIQYLTASRAPQKLLLIFEEFQTIIESIEEGSQRQNDAGLDKRVLDVFQGLLDERILLFVLTGSIRLQHLHKIRHAFFGRVRQVPVSFVDAEATAQILRKPVERDGIIFEDSAIERVWELTHGYPWVIQQFGEEALKRIAADRRRIVSPADIDDIATSFMANREIFQWWWDQSYMGDAETQVIAKIIELVPRNEPITRDFWLNKFPMGIEIAAVKQNLCDQQVLKYDSTCEQHVFKGALLRSWLPRMLDESQRSDSTSSGYCGLAIDHENMYISLLEALGDVSGAVALEALHRCLVAIKADAESVGHLVFRKAIAMWEQFSLHQQVYWKVDAEFSLPRPPISEKDASDEEMRRQVIVEMMEEEFLPKGKRGIDTVVIVSGDQRFCRLVAKLQEQGRKVLVRGWKGHTSEKLIQTAGPHFKYLDEIVSLSAHAKTGGR